MDLFEELVDTPSKNRFWVVLVAVSLFTYTVAIAGMYGSEGWGALLARFDKAKAWLSRPRKVQEKTPPPDTDGSTSSVDSKGKAPANGNSSSELGNPAENTADSGTSPMTGSIWDRLPPMNLTRRRMKTPGNDEEAAKPGVGGEAAGASGEKKTKAASPEEGRRWGASLDVEVDGSKRGASLDIEVDGSKGGARNRELDHFLGHVFP